MLPIHTFDQRQGGNVLYKALAHPLAAEALAALSASLANMGPIAVFDPDGIAEALFVLHPALPPIEGIYVQDVREVGREHAGHRARPLDALREAPPRAVLVAAFDAGRLVARLAGLLPADTRIVSLDQARLPEAMLTVPRRYLDRLNFATNFAFFRDAEGFSTRLVTANYWSGYGASALRLWLRLFDADGRVLATWEEAVPAGPAGIAIDSAEVRGRFGLTPFTGQLFIHAIGAAGHDVVKYALDTYASDGGASLSCTHDANAWPAERYAGLPAPREDERVILWLQNSHAVPIPAGALALDRMGAERPVALNAPVPPFATIALDVASLLPGLRWPAQIELRAGRHVVRPRYEVVRAGRRRIAHVNVERTDLRPDPVLATLDGSLGRGFLLPFPILPRGRFRSIVQPTPMADTQADLPLRLEIRIGCVENSVSGTAMRPLDVLHSRRGLSIEVGNTDAEGRLVLADLLAEASDAKPALLIDCATLTGAARAATGPDLPALFCNDEAWAESLLRHGLATHDPLWRLPLWEGYDGWLESTIADVNNIAGKTHAGAVVAALFLRRFVAIGTVWSHIDLYAWNDQTRPGRPEGGEAQAMRAIVSAITDYVNTAR